MSHLKKILIAGLTLLFLWSFSDSAEAGPAASIRDAEDLDQFIIDTMSSNHIPGLAACIVKNKRVLWTGTYGYAHIEENRPVETSTLFELASISKTITNTALMQLHEQRAFGLDDDINDYLPFNVRHPYFPAAPITFRQLVTHTSSIKDNWDVMFYFWGTDSPIPLGEYLEDYLTPGGAYYDPDRNFYGDVNPGDTWHYSNIGITLVGYLIEVIAGIPFDAFTEDHIFTPLGMDETAWFLADLDPTHIAMPYHWNGTEYEPYGYFGYTDYPAGQLRTSVDQLAAFLTCYMQSGAYQGETILSPKTVDLIFTIQRPDLNPRQGLVWFYMLQFDRHLWGHGGGDFGIATRMFFDPSTRIGVIILTNGEKAWPLQQIENELFTYAENCFYLKKPLEQLEK
jgi:CubicO group peptidase (beta-lactamase class C family)